MSDDCPINILVIDEDPDRAAILEQGLVEGDYARVMLIHNLTNLEGRIAALEPDVILINLENPDRDTLENMYQVSRSVARPIAMFVDQYEPGRMEEAIEAGVSAYVVDGLKKERVGPIVEMAISRFRMFDRLRKERDDARNALQERKRIERAKGLLMERKGISEEQAYHAMRKAAMQENRKLVEIADSLITALQMDI
ncbi:ANTAR domain-containing response regulator [Magnetococcus sp. PR-3]|uniref:ANTAR domain-containing response regulator n=1 Tax=Magnetococcus sp. PR-3 TaxID=3120355 RepID=UPI002FCE147B